ncbi:glycoside hydrolase family 3 N-terminal domain-containing protein [Streptomyces sp. NPDC057137]|uniref:glycoside hydrolase family 3 N-terminal domain-containing protein n=1 Tax=Streptomyces sp. NPDC057137 TaxID=3346030 RepID=UPI0036343F6F
MSDTVRDAHAILFPAIPDLSLRPWMLTLLQAGTVAVLCGESREEYVAREMTQQRQSSESAGDVSGFISQVRNAANAPVLVAVDQEPWGTRRLHRLVPSFPAPADYRGLSDEEIRESAATVASAALALGVNTFLSPVLDVLRGPNPWLEGRTLPGGHDEVARVAAAVVQGMQGAGVLCVAKHFPGFPSLTLDPALEDTSMAAESSHLNDLVPFRGVVDAGVGAVMTGPAVVSAVDASQPASTSPAVMDLLRRHLGFEGLVVSDELDAPGILHGRTLCETTFASLQAGVELLLVPGGPELLDLAAQVADRCRRDSSFASIVSQAARKARNVAAARS